MTICNVWQNYEHVKTKLTVCEYGVSIYYEYIIVHNNRGLGTRIWNSSMVILANDMVLMFDLLKAFYRLPNRRVMKIGDPVNSNSKYGDLI